ncbi:hypothetical protein COT87_03105 [Candidatus Collierbacteria bacterium CG10_big_fil_rev_8_21_14_0_10_44_9]|uniref:Uncharacterized protein n=1 Tax=Candidatus Collierbacteria bacterium CG10_big_fil_rev_8_21_14_0_10_44_9 TaxID=1974535 RepID=A0A2H0VI19_9BACT|nr:MAG: hypothetical protein COT87_03105 [Candidatus Collierbacteria bacterium CG10_big_fil_rev_8_21_14_0_10_44_9]
MEENINPNSLEIHPAIEPPLPLSKQLVEQASSKVHSSKFLYITIIFSFLLILGISIFFFYIRTPTKPATLNLSDSSFQTVSRKIENFAKSVVGNNPSSLPIPSVIPVPSPIQSSIDEIITTSGYTNKQIDYTDKSGPTLDNVNLKIKIPGLQSNLLIHLVFAADMQSIYPIYLQNPEINTLNDIATKLGIQAKSTYPDSQRKFNIEYVDPEAKLSYDSGAGNGTLSFESKPGSGDLPTITQAEDIATTTLQSIDISMDSLKSSVVESSISSIYENFASVHKAIAVNYLQEKDGYPVVLGDVNFFNNTPSGATLSPAITVIITGGGKIARIQIANYGQYLGNDPVLVNSRPLNLAVEELKTYGGHIRNITELDGQRSYFACVNNKCDVHDATITSAKLSYYWNNSLPTLSYSEINDTTPRAFEYLLPVWVFEGTGKMNKSKTDESGKLIPNPDISDPDQYYEQSVKFIATIPAFSTTNDVNLLSARNYTLSKTENNTFKVTFDTLYHFPTFNTASFMNAEPRNGIKYKLLILFPDKTYTVINGYKQEVYQGEVSFSLSDQKGVITTYLELSDFSNLIEKRTLQFD